MSGVNPAPVKRWLASVYPTLQLDPVWLDECLHYLSTHRQDLMGATLLKTVEQQILLSPLESCTASGSLPPGASEEQDGILSPGKGQLLQIISMDEVGHSALHLKETLQARREDAKLGVEADRVRVQGLTQEGEAEDAGTGAAGVSGGGAARFPRAMLKLELSDGHSTLQALEYRRIPALDLGSTDLGSKLLLKNARLRRGVVLLEPETVTLKGAPLFLSAEDETRRDMNSILFFCNLLLGKIAHENMITGGSIQELKEAQDDLLEAQLTARLDAQE